MPTSKMEIGSQPKQQMTCLCALHLMLLDPLRDLQGLWQQPFTLRPGLRGFRWKCRIDQVDRLLGPTALRFPFQFLAQHGLHQSMEREDPRLCLTSEQRVAP